MTARPYLHRRMDNATAIGEQLQIPNHVSQRIRELGMCERKLIETDGVSFGDLHTLELLDKGAPARVRSGK